MQKIISKLIGLSIIVLSYKAFSGQPNECTCCNQVETAICALSPSIAPNVNIKFDFKNTESNITLFAIEFCANPFEITRSHPSIEGSTNAGQLTLVLCNRDKVMDVKQITIISNYFARCKISQNIICED
ncbi:hypothetical protein SC870_14390 [Legionella pneumophila serogroup 1]|nr:hypothetical protein [Legionella pneumophila]